MRINDDDKFATMRVELFLHAERVGESVRIPGEVLFLIGIFEIEPDHVVRDAGSVELAVHIPHIFV